MRVAEYTESARIYLLIIKVILMFSGKWEMTTSYEKKKEDLSIMKPSIGE